MFDRTRSSLVLLCLCAVVGALFMTIPIGSAWFTFRARADHSERETQAASAGELQKPEPRKVSPYLPPKGYVCYRAKGKITIDGKLDDAWRDAPWTDDFVDIEGDAKPKPRFRTRAKMLWDDNYFYIAAELEEPHVWGTLTQHDSVIFQDNDFEVFIDPNGDNHEYYEFEINALNTGWDLLLPMPYRDGGQAINGWEIPGLKTAIHVDGTLNDSRDKDKGWSVEMAFPWHVLGELAYQKVPPKDGAQWRVNFSRVEWLHDIVDGKYKKVKGKSEDNWVWSPQGAIDMHRPETWGYVQFTSAPPGKAQIKPDETGLARYLLHQVYYGQRDYRAKHSRWAPSLDALGLSKLEWTGLAEPIGFFTTPDLFQATTVLKGGQRVHIRHDSKIWMSK